MFKVNDIALNYRDMEGDLIRVLDDEDIQLMIKESRGQESKIKRPVNQFAWELYVTLASDLSVYNTELWRCGSEGGVDLHLDRVADGSSLHFRF